MSQLQDELKFFHDKHNIDFCCDIKNGSNHIQHGIIPDIINLQSVSKEFIKAAILLLCEQGKISLFDSILKYIDITHNHKSMIKFYDWKGWRKITIEHLLKHESGIVDFINEMHDFDDVDYIAQYDILHPYDDVLRACAKYPLHFEAGTDVLYSNSNYYILSFIIERLTQLSVDDFVFRNIVGRAPSLKPLPCGNLPITDYIGSHVSRIPGYYIPNPWPQGKDKGIFAMTVEDLHNFAFKIETITPSYAWRFFERGVLDNNYYGRFHSVAGCSDTGNVTIHCFDYEKQISIVMYCDAFSEEIYNDCLTLGNIVLKEGI